MHLASTQQVTQIPIPKLNGHISETKTKKKIGHFPLTEEAK